jgi:hypothetical protein
MDKIPGLIVAVECWLSYHITGRFREDNLSERNDRVEFTKHPCSLALCYHSEEDGIIDFAVKVEDGQLLFELTQCVPECDGDCDLWNCSSNNSLFAL